MEQVDEPSAGGAVITLPAILDLTTAPGLKQDLLKALAQGDGLELDAGEVQRVTSPCLQVLVAAARSFAQAGGPALRFGRVSAAFAETVSCLALTNELGITGEMHD